MFTTSNSIIILFQTHKINMKIKFSQPQIFLYFGMTENHNSDDGPSSPVSPLTPPLPHWVHPLTW